MIDALPINRFQDLVASYGADPDRWPTEQRCGAIGCLVQSEAARDAWRDAADLDADLDSVPDQPASSELVDRVVAIGDAAKAQKSSIVVGVFRHTLPYAAAAAIALVVGLAVPSPLRDAAGVAVLDEAAVGQPQIVTDTNAGITTLALVDAGTFADDEADPDGVLSDDSLLNDLPLL